MLFISFPIFSYLIRPQVTRNTGYTKPYENPNKSNLLGSYKKIIHGSHKLPIKSLSLLEELFFQSQTTWLTATISSIQSMMNSLQNGRYSFIFTTLLVQSPPIIRFSTSVSFHLPFHLCLFTTLFLQSPPTIPSPKPQQFLTFLFLRTNIPVI